MVDLEAALGDVLSREVPTVPTAASIGLRIAELDRRGDLPMDELRSLAFADPAVAAALLASANAVDGPPVLSLPEAAERLGEATFLRIVRGAARAEEERPGPLLALRQRTWRVAVVSAALCRELARARGLPPEDAYTCGLLHDVGRLAAFVALERVAAGSRPLRAVSLPRWERLADRWHVALGAAFAERHRLPRAVLDVIAFHHREPTGAGAPSPLLRVVRTVDVLAAVLADGAEPDDAVEGADLTPAEAARLARTVERAQGQLAALERLSAPGRAPRGTSGPALALRESKGEGVRLRLAGREYTATGFAAYQLLVCGPAPLGEGALLEVEVLDRARPPFHARVLAAWAEGDRFGAILLPLGLSGPSLADFGGGLPAGAAA